MPSLLTLLLATSRGASEDAEGAPREAGSVSEETMSFREACSNLVKAVLAARSNCEKNAFRKTSGGFTLSDKDGIIRVLVSIKSSHIGPACFALTSKLIMTVSKGRLLNADLMKHSDVRGLLPECLASLTPFERNSHEETVYMRMPRTKMKGK